MTEQESSGQVMAPGAEQTGKTAELLNWLPCRLTRQQLMLSVIVIGAVVVLVDFGSRYAGTGVTEKPYAYLSPDTSADPAVKELAALVEGATARVYELSLPDLARPLATVQVLQQGNGDGTVVGWKSHVSQPVLRSDIYPEEELALVKALRNYLPQGAIVLAMPALSSRLSAVIDAKTGAMFPLAGYEARQGLQVPARWQADASGVAALETRWQYASSVNANDQTWELFAQALLAENAVGRAMLLEITNAREAYIVLHVRDIFDLGASPSTPLPVGIKDFAGADHAHDVTRRVKDWRLAHGYVAQAVTRLPDGRIRSYYLSEAKHKSTLIARLLPFDSSKPGLIPGSRLVFQTGGYWVYHLPGVPDGDV